MRIGAMEMGKQGQEFELETIGRKGFELMWLFLINWSI